MANEGPDNENDFDTCDTVPCRHLTELDALRSRVADLELQLRTVTKQRDAALGALGEGAADLTTENGGDGAIEVWQPANTCRYCDGEGILWVHDFRMDCKRCGGTGVAPDP
jgi:hypothetical protein